MRSCFSDGIGKKFNCVVDTRRSYLVQWFTVTRSSQRDIMFVPRRILLIHIFPPFWGTQQFQYYRCSSQCLPTRHDHSAISPRNQRNFPLSSPISNCVPKSIVVEVKPQLPRLRPRISNFQFL
ncbi:hypothetical protein NPIL_622921 [Nephila pilipes]|uniref:Uncharacterized protein n=1 Tax=Nephila pilipes TaxID=299642 RepID=A0A8X6MX42_NEPPI|nr:hypothetical protein NPIL_622921 [Nephila pilipes]